MATAAISTTQYLTFKLDEESFALEVSKVREVLELTKITRVPDAPEFMRGMINVRGSVVPVIDMRLKFGMNATQEQTSTRIIVMEIDRDGKTIVVGSLADSVKEVIDLSDEQIEPAPDIGTRWNRDLMRGVGKHNDEFIIILDIDKVFSTNEMMVLTGPEIQHGEATQPPA
ncbi:MAG: chemotaxis protein CheW [Deltaproteobacteria bacterium]|nr:chemotaxis protein CheW [Deltaproteobacteria bacterium]